jgi:hypothetical protein
MPRAVVHYRLLGLRARVKVVRLSLTRAVPGAALTVRCVRRCRASTRSAAGADGRASIAGLRGRWLARGAIVEIRVSRAGWGGHVARVTVTGAPKGVRITHSCTTPNSRARVPCSRLARR